MDKVNIATKEKSVNPNSMFEADYHRVDLKRGYLIDSNDEKLDLDNYPRYVKAYAKKLEY